jgi:streptomycin 6-kinase
MHEPSDEMRRRLVAWGVTPTGPGFSTPSSELMPGRTRLGAAVMLKLALVDEEVRGAALLRWWGGRGAAAVLERDGGATLMARATGRRDLTAMAGSGQDAEATRILVQTVLTLHDGPVPTATHGVELLPLGDWFLALMAGELDDPLLRRAAGFASRLIDGTSSADVVALHGDIHHGNVLDFGDRWAAIDPKGLIGHRAFDFANILCNPSERSALDNLPARLAMISRQARIDPLVLAEWTIAWCGLSLAWGRDTDVSSDHARAVRSVAEILLERHPAG